MLSLLLLVGRGRRLLVSVTAFTAAHSVTLAAAALGWVFVPSAPVEATIALSVVFLAAEVARTQTADRSFTRERPWLVAFAFGLLHGFGFAGALSDVGLPAAAIPTALLFFNLGVELGQLAFIGASLVLAVAAAPLWMSRKTVGLRWAAYCLGAIGSFWTIERTLGFWA